MSKRFTAEELAKLRGIAEAATDAIERALFNNNPDAARSAERGLHFLLDTLATQAAEIERLRRERDLYRDLSQAQEKLLTAYRIGGRTPERALDTIRRVKDELALLDGEKDGDRR